MYDILDLIYYYVIVDYLVYISKKNKYTQLLIYEVSMTKGHNKEVNLKLFVVLKI